ncbi:hypothetical protein Sa4125_04600 [Aureimonas sp. SA4125]|nr:hypothetical protein Sa4125_04600 [Aureimonas sp. SA4125]
MGNYSELRTFEAMHAYQLANSEGIRLGELDDQQRVDFKVLIIKKLAEFVIVEDGSFRCIPTRMGRGVLLTWEIQKLLEQP